MIRVPGVPSRLAARIPSNLPPLSRSSPQNYRFACRKAYKSTTDE